MYCVSSGAPASAAVEQDVLRAESAGRSTKEDFSASRLEVKEHVFFEPIKRLHLKTIADMNKSVKVTTSTNKTVRQCCLSTSSEVTANAKKTGPEKAAYISTFPCATQRTVGLPDNFLAKTDKSKGLQYIAKDLDDVIPDDPKSCLVIEDVNAIFYYLMDIPRTFEEISGQIQKAALHKSSRDL